jgi:hypothetical protein
MTKQGGYNPALSFDKRRYLSNSLVKCFVDIARRDSIHSKSSYYRYLIEHDKSYIFATYFERYGSYRVGLSDYKYRLHTESLQLMDEVLKKFSELDFIEYEPKESDIVFSKELLSQIKLQDAFYLLSHCLGTNNGSYVIENKVQDVQYSRKYSVFTSISNDTRRKFGFKGYDISSCLQSIALGILGSKNYPIHSMLMRNKERFRNVIAKRLDKDIADVKEILTAGDNGKQYKKLRLKSKLLDKYLIEAETLADEFNTWMSDTHSYRFKIAYGFAKEEWVKTGKYDSDTGKPIFEKSGKKNKYSLFFFNWTQIERDVRKIMIESVPSNIFVHEVHDAIYVPNEIVLDIKNMEHKIFDSLGLRIKIE